MPMIRRAALLAATLSISALTCFGASAQQSPTSSRVRGAIQSVNGDIVVVKGRDGTNTMMKMTPDVRVTGVTKITLADIKPGSYIGVTSVPGADGTQKATEVHVFPESMRGAGEGTRPWDTRPNSSMTNGGLDKRVDGADGNVLTVKYKDGEKQVVVTPDTELVTFVPAERSEIKPGAQIVAFTAKGDDGALQASRISVGLDGLTPPM
ncbi:MAG: hypothetical protein EKK40_17580 [Bradyrhizobiaceae bacterium]|nr:MAG: hypothetical protein EKK40_17580 [Bradyrhizobiaceae bacterium]